MKYILDWTGNIAIGSTSGYRFKRDNNSGEISWSSKLQKCVPTSTVKAKFNISEASKETVDLSYLPKAIDAEVEESKRVFLDNQACIGLSINSINDNKIKNVSLKFHIVLNFIQN